MRFRTMKNVLVGGGTGGVGEGIVRALLAAGHLVVVPSRSAAKLERLRGDVAAGERLVTVEGDVGALAGARAVRERIARDVGRIDALVPSLGGWWEGALLDVTPGVWDDVMNEMLRTHFIFAHVFLPVVRAQRGGGRYIAIGGGAAYHPVRGSSLVSIAAAAQAMFTRALHQELSESDVEVLELIVDGPVRTRDSAALATPDWITAGEVGAVVAELVAGGRTSDPAVRATGPLLRMRPHPRPGAAP
jgi:NAD(P)-dependent dehydrogenase (short-subunit alcohol dehydrogenase family)